MVHEDRRLQFEKEGRTLTVVRSTAKKAWPGPFGAMTELDRRHLQAIVDAQEQRFTRDVAHYRGRSPAVVRAKFGQGRTVLGREALELGMVDGLANRM